MNITLLVGRLGKNIEIRPAGQHKVGEFSLATSRNGETKWFTCIAWNKQAEFIEKHLGRGLRAVVAGELYDETWEDQQGNEKSRQKLNVLKVEPIDWKEKTELVENNDFVPTDGDNKIPF